MKLATLLAPSGSRGLVNRGAPVLSFFNDQMMPLTRVIAQTAKTYGCIRMDLESWNIGGRAAEDLCAWARRLRLPIRLTVPPHVASSNVGRACAEAGIDVVAQKTHQKRSTLVTNSGPVEIYGSQNLEDMGHASLETILTCPPELARQLHAWTDTRPACFRNTLTELGYRHVDLVTWGVNGDEVCRLAEKMHLRVIYWRGASALKAHRKSNWYIPADVECRPGPVHAKFAICDNRHLLLTSANLTRNRNAETFVLIEDPHAVEKARALFDGLLRTDTAIRTRPQFDSFLRRIARA